MARKKIVFVIVEGPSDESALALMLDKLFDKQTVHVHVLRRDITTEIGVDSSNIAATIAEEVEQYANSLHLVDTHFQEIIHIVDTDGAYIPNENVIEDKTLPDHLYSPTEIRTPNKANIEQRNLQKSWNLNRLITTKKIWKIPYSVYYMSCNLDHALYGKLNTSDEDKEKDAHAFANVCILLFVGKRLACIIRKYGQLRMSFTLINDDAILIEMNPLTFIYKNK